MRIISLAPSNTEILYALGAEKELIACTRFCDYPKEAKKKKRIGGWLDIKEDLIKELKPDIVLTSTFVQADIVKRLKKDKIKVKHFDVTTLDQIYDSILELGKLVGKQKEAKELVDNMRTKVEAIGLRLKKVKDKPKLYIEEWHDPPHVSGNWIPKMVEICKAKYSLIKEGEHSKTVSEKEIQKYNPDKIIVSLCGFGTKARREILTERDGWDKLKAVKNNDVYVIDDSLLNRPGPRIVEGLQKIAEIVHPREARIIKGDFKYSKDFKEYDASEDFEERFIYDPYGYFLIRILDDEIQLGHCKRINEFDVIVRGKTAKEICEKAVKLKLMSRLDHATYLGRELQKAENCLLNKREYVQDD